MRNFFYIIVAALTIFTAITSASASDRLTQIPNPVPQNASVTETPINIKAFLGIDTSDGSERIYDTTKWKNLMDMTWGEGVSTEEKLRLFDRYWDTVSAQYPCFVNLKKTNWDSLAKSLRDEIAAGVSRGRFAGIMSNLVYHLNDAHTYFIDMEIRNSDLYLGLPAVMNHSVYMFPGCLTALPDSTALVYDAKPDNPFDLRPGDIILGYNGKSLAYLADEIIRHKLPVYATFGSTYAATNHNMIIATACSWNLYDTIDIKRYNGGIDHISTTKMLGAHYFNPCFEIVPPKNIKLPMLYDLYKGKQNVCGVIEGTNTGYVAMFSCMDKSGDSLYKHIREMVENKHVNGLIIDIRTNLGGLFSAFDKTFSYLSDLSLVNWLSYGERSDPNDRYSTKWQPYLAQAYNLYDDDPARFEGPIVILTGPNAMSSGDFLPLTFRNYPRVKIFGQPTSGAFGALKMIELNGPDYYYATMQTGNFYLVSDDPSQFLSHREIGVHHKIWMTPEAVAEGYDNVIESALAYVDTHTDVDELSAEHGIEVSPNPASDFIDIRLGEVILSETKDLKIYNTLGECVLSPLAFGEGPGVRLDISSLRTGAYFVSINIGKEVLTGSFMVVR
jgi:C-terminal processing protease CtpA/Prc